jgi:hypothetical protein
MIGCVAEQLIAFCTKPNRDTFTTFFIFMAEGEADI